MADDHRDDRITAAAAPVDRIQRRKHVRRRHARRADALQLRGKHVQQHLGVRRGVEMAPILVNEDRGELRGVRQIAVVRKTDAVGRIDVERLRFGGAIAAGGRVAHVADADVALQLHHVVLLEHVAHEAAALAHVQLAFARGHDAGRILPAVLQHGQRVVKPLVDRAVSDHADNSAHARSPLSAAALCRGASDSRDTRMHLRRPALRRPLATRSAYGTSSDSATSARHPDAAAGR